MAGSPVSSSICFWNSSASALNSAHSVFGEKKGVLSTDTVVKFGWYDGPTSGRGGYAIKRGEKIVAEYVAWLS